MIKRLLPILAIPLLLGACESAFQTSGYKAVAADCRLQGYLPSSRDYRDCVKVGKHKVDVADMQQRMYMMQQYQSMGAAWAPQPTYAPAPAPVQPNTQFCYPGAGFTYCQ
ncbi:MAG: hypothetical protein ACR2RF_32225 [Geminicoccaceae bacterium]